MRTLFMAILVSLLPTNAFADGSVHNLSQGQDGALNASNRDGSSSVVITQDKLDSGIELTVIPGCSIGNLCASTFTPIQSDPTNGSTSTCTKGFFHRMGDIVKMSVSCTFTPAGAGASSFEITLPEISVNFPTGTDAGGTCSSNITGVADNWFLLGIAGKQEVLIATNDAINANGRVIYCSFGYEI